MGRLWLDALDRNKVDMPRIFSNATAEKFWSLTHVPDSVWALGWDGISSERSSAGRFFSKRTRGHLGFTGTSIWIDPTNDLIVTLLTNRVHPTRNNEKMKPFRPLFHDSLLRELGLDAATDRIKIKGADA